jgi:hypothetical protein
MSARVYIVLDILEVNLERVLKELQNLKGIVVDKLEGHPNTMVIIEAPDRQKLAERLMPVLNFTDDITRNIHLVMSRENVSIPNFQSALVYEPASVN